MAKRLENLLKRVHKTNNCWLWEGTVSNAGYGRFVWSENSKSHAGSAHRVMYELLVGEVKKGYVLDHLCRNRLCVNPNHLEQVTNRENLMRSNITEAYKNSVKTHCNNGHELVKNNIYYRKDRFGRECKTCRNERSRAWQQS